MGDVKWRLRWFAGASAAHTAQVGWWVAAGHAEWIDVLILAWSATTTGGLCVVAYIAGVYQDWEAKARRDLTALAHQLVEEERRRG